MTFSVSTYHLGTIATIETTPSGKVKFTRNKSAVAIGAAIPPSNESDLCKCALYLEKERAAISASCCGYTVTKL